MHRQSAFLTPLFPSIDRLIFRVIGWSFRLNWWFLCCLFGVFRVGRRGFPFARDARLRRRSCLGPWGGLGTRGLVEFRTGGKGYGSFLIFWRRVWACVGPTLGCPVSIVLNTAVRSWDTQWGSVHLPHPKHCSTSSAGFQFGLSERSYRQSPTLKTARKWHLVSLQPT